VPYLWNGPRTKLVYPCITSIYYTFYSVSYEKLDSSVCLDYNLNNKIFIRPLQSIIYSGVCLE